MQQDTFDERSLLYGGLFCTKVKDNNKNKNYRPKVKSNSNTKNGENKMILKT